MKKLLVLAVLLLGSLIALGTLAAPGTTNRRPPASSVGPADQATLQQDAAMTQGMSAPNAGGPMQTYGTVDAQLQHSQDPAFVRQLEQYQSDVDRMLGRLTP